uniref:Uncharacterized protein n=1 Tax=Glossina austeni TaxID=7395 RepID=A0A1A9V020_GLOAU
MRNFVLLMDIQVLKSLNTSSSCSAKYGVDYAIFEGIISKNEVFSGAKFYGAMSHEMLVCVMVMRSEAWEAIFLFCKRWHSWLRSTIICFCLQIHACKMLFNAMTNEFNKSSIFKRN